MAEYGYGTWGRTTGLLRPMSCLSTPESGYTRRTKHSDRRIASGNGLYVVLSLNRGSLKHKTCAIAWTQSSEFYDQINAIPTSLLTKVVRIENEKRSTGLDIEISRGRSSSSYLPGLRFSISRPSRLITRLVRENTFSLV